MHTVQHARIQYSMCACSTACVHGAQLPSSGTLAVVNIVALHSTGGSSRSALRSSSRQMRSAGVKSAEAAEVAARCLSTHMGSGAVPRSASLCRLKTLEEERVGFGGLGVQGFSVGTQLDGRLLPASLLSLSLMPVGVVASGRV